ncbi:MAG: hypothetical protein RL186_1017 [Pseudomonadota bacterium]
MRIIAPACEAVLAFLCIEHCDEGTVDLPEARDCALADATQFGFEFCEGFFYRVEVRAVGREEGECGARSFDQQLDRQALVVGQNNCTRPSCSDHPKPIPPFDRDALLQSLQFPSDEIASGSQSTAQLIPAGAGNTRWHHHPR